MQHRGCSAAATAGALPGHSILSAEERRSRSSHPRPPSRRPPGRSREPSPSPRACWIAPRSRPLASARTPRRSSSRSARGVSTLGEPVRERHRETARVRRGEGLLKSRHARSAFGARLPGEGPAAERPAPPLVVPLPGLLWGMGTGGGVIGAIGGGRELVGRGSRPSRGGGGPPAFLDWGEPWRCLRRGLTRRGGRGVGSSI